MAVPEVTRALSVKPPGEATEHAAPPPSAPPPAPTAEPKAAGSPKMAYMPVPETTKSLSVKPPGEATEHAAPPPSAPAASEPKAAGSPKMAYMPVPESTKSLSVKPPGEATEHAAPPPSVPASSNASGDPKAPGSPKMAFMAAPAPGAGSALSVSGGHGKPAEAPAAAEAAPPPVPANSNPASAKTFRPSGPPPSNGFGAGITGAIIGAIVGAIFWYVIATNWIAMRILAWIPGLCAGALAVAMAKKRTSHKLGVAAAVITGIITILTQFAVISAKNEQSIGGAAEADYASHIAVARGVVDAKGDDELKKAMQEDDGFHPSVTANNDEAALLAEYRTKRLPEMKKFAGGEPSKTRYIEKRRGELAAEGGYGYNVSGLNLILMILWIGSGISSAFKMGRGAKK